MSGVNGGAPALNQQRNVARNLPGWLEIFHPRRHPAGDKRHRGQQRPGLGAARTGTFAEAREHFQAALQHKPDCVLAHCNLGMLSEEAGNLQEAECS